jgi:4-carboxymuconolactone decarboxylase
MFVHRKRPIEEQDLPPHWPKSAVLISLLHFAVIGAVGGAQPASAQTDPREQRGLRVISELSGGQGQQVLDRLRRDFPPLGDAVLNFAIGDIFGRTVIDVRTRQLAALAAFAAQGQLAYFKIHAGYALNAGVKPEELAEIVYLTTVTAGFPRAIDAAQALREVLAERSIALPLTPKN